MREYADAAARIVRWRAGSTARFHTSAIKVPRIGDLYKSRRDVVAERLAGLILAGVIGGRGSLRVGANQPARIISERVRRFHASFSRLPRTIVLRWVSSETR